MVHPFTAQERRDADRWAAKDAEFARRRRDSDWPMDECAACWKRQGCCVSYSHHVGDCCLHCGNDERRADICNHTEEYSVYSKLPGYEGTWEITADKRAA